MAAWGVLALGAALRFGAIGAGAPYRIANDEPFVVGMALRIMQSGDFNPHFFHYGGLTIYLHTLVAACRFLFGALTGEWTSLDGIWIGNYLTSARVVTAAIGSVTVFLVYRVGLRLGPAPALLAAFIMAVLPPHVRESRYALTDTPLTMLTTLVLLLSLRASEQRHVAAVVSAGFVAGLAASAKYSGAVSLIMPLMAALVLPAGSRLRGLGLAVVAAAGGFLITSPYTVIDLPAFLNGFADLSSNYNQGRPFLEASGTYVKHLRGWFIWPNVVPLNTGFVAVTLSVVGCVLIAWRGRSATTWIGSAILLVYPCVWFVMLSKQSSLQYGRYLLPMAPVLCLGIAMAMIAGWTQSARVGMVWRWGLRVVLLAILIAPAGAALSGVRDHARPRTAELASAWLAREIPKNETIVVEAAAVSLPPSMNVLPMNRLIDKPVDYYRQRSTKYLVTTAAETARYFGRPKFYARELEAFQRLLIETDTVATFEPKAGVLGPRITILRVTP
jgi:4-amino-4-deoxy-L-arabinose transferase-like glycosyltransferase